MYIRKTRKTVKGKTYTHYLLVESVATPKGPRQRTICSLGDLSPRPAAEWLKLAHKVEQALAGQADLLEAPDAEVEAIVTKVPGLRRGFTSRRPGISRRPKATRTWRRSTPTAWTRRRSGRRGRCMGAEAFWKRLGVDEILRDANLDPATHLLTLAMVMNRLIAPRSENAMPDWIRAMALGDLTGEDFSALSNQALYRNMDHLYEKRGAIEAALVARERDLFDLDTTVYLYDLTST